MVDRNSFRTHCLQHDIPLISKDTEIFLRSWIAKHQPNHIAEIGSAIGYSTCVLADSMQDYTQY